MKRINLLPQELKESSRKGKAQKYFAQSPGIKLVVFMILVLGFTSLYLFSLSVKYKVSVSKKKEAVKELQAQLERSQDDEALIKKQIEVIEEKNKYLAKRAAFLEKTRTASIKWSKVARLVEVLLSDDLWLTKMDLNKTMITLNGTTVNSKRVSEFMTRLDKSGYFTSTSFNYTRKKKDKGVEIKGGSATDFEITTALRR